MANNALAPEVANFLAKNRNKSVSDYADYSLPIDAYFQYVPSNKDDNNMSYTIDRIKEIFKDDPKRMLQALQSLRLFGGGGDMGGIGIAGGGQLVTDIPINERLTVSPKYGGGGFSATIHTPEGNRNISHWTPNYGVSARYRF